MLNILQNVLFTSFCGAPCNQDIGHRWETRNTGNVNDHSNEIMESKSWGFPLWWGEDTSMLSATWDVKHKVWGILTTSYSEHSIACRLRNRAGYNFLYCSISCDACRRDVGFTVQPRLCKNAICTSKCISGVKIKICSECCMIYGTGRWHEV
jgi:hypothetical protein